ncbi:MAG TPA: hypothetical protein VF712_11280 [Thermoleophilaceae bacterium]
MADWSALRNYIKGNYKVAQDDLDTLHLLFETEGGRSQKVLVTNMGDSGWAMVYTAVCQESDINPRDALVKNSNMTVGSLALVEGGPVIFRHTFPLADLDPDEFEAPLHVAVQYGDRLERELTGKDTF